MIPEHDPQIALRSTTLGAAPNSVTKQEVLCYSNDSYNNVIEHDEYKFGASAPSSPCSATPALGSPYRRTITTYVVNNASNGTKYANQHILDLPTAVQLNQVTAGLG